jgi:hypothetical protein
MKSSVEPLQNDPDGVNGEVGYEQTLRGNALQQLADLLSASLIQQAFEPDVWKPRQQEHKACPERSRTAHLWWAACTGLWPERAHRLEAGATILSVAALRQLLLARGQ